MKCFAAVPTLQANSAQILLDPHLRTVRLHRRRAQLRQSGLVSRHLGRRRALPSRRRRDPGPAGFGLPSPVAGALLAAPDGIWVATERHPASRRRAHPRGSRAEVIPFLHGLPASGVPFSQVRDLAGQGTGVWAATDAGAARIETRDGRVDLDGCGPRLPGQEGLRGGSRQGRITVGTARGLARITDALRVERVAPAFSRRAYAVFPRAIRSGSARPGLLVAFPGERDLVRPSTLASPSLQGAGAGVGSLGDTLVGLTRDQMLWRDPRTRAWTGGTKLSAVLGGLRNFTADGTGFWVAGERGVGFARLGTPPRPLLRRGPSRARERCGSRQGFPLGGHRRRPRALPARRRPAVSGEFERIPGSSRHWGARAERNRRRLRGAFGRQRRHWWSARISASRACTFGSSGCASRGRLARRRRRRCRISPPRAPRLRRSSRP